MSYSNLRIALVTVLALILSLTVANPVSADEVAGHVAAARAGNLRVVAVADRVATASAAAQAAAGSLFHADLSELIGTCSAAGEIVGSGPDVAAVFQAFQLSAAHRDILSNPAWNAMGTGLAPGTDGLVYVSVVFCRVSNPAAADAEEAPARTVETRVQAQSVGLPDQAETSSAVRPTDVREWLDPQAASMLSHRQVLVCGAGDGTREFDQPESASCVRAT